MRNAVVAILVVSVTGFIGAYALLAQPGGGTKAPGPVPFQFKIDSLSLKVNDKQVVNGPFQSVKTFTNAFRVLVGRISSTNLRQGTLTLDDKSTAPTWNVHAALLAIPPAAGRMAIAGRELFPLEISVRLRSVQLKGPERIYVGLMDNKTLYNVGSVSLSVQGLDKQRVAGLRRSQRPRLAQAGLSSYFRLAFFDVLHPEDPFDKIIDVLDIGPAVSLVRAEEPQISGDIILDSKLTPILANADVVDMTLKVGAQGDFSANGVITAGQNREEFSLSPKQQNPAAFFAPRSRLALDANLVAVVYAQTLPRVAVFSVEQSAPASGAGGAKTVPIVVHGIGFALDSKLEVIPEGSGAPATVSGLAIGRDCLTLKANVNVPAQTAPSYSVRVTSAGSTVTHTKALTFVGQL